MQVSFFAKLAACAGLMVLCSCGPRKCNVDWGNVDASFSSALRSVNSLDGIKSIRDQLGGMVTSFAFQIENETPDHAEESSDIKVISFVYAPLIGDVLAWEQRIKAGVTNKVACSAVCKRVQSLINAYPVGLRGSEEETRSMVLFLRYATQIASNEVTCLLEGYVRQKPAGKEMLPFLIILEASGNQVGIDGVAALLGDMRSEIDRLRKIANPGKRHARTR